MLNNLLNNLQNEKITYILAIILIILCGNLYTPKIPTPIKNIVNSEVGRIIIISGIAYISNININLAILLSLLFIYLSNTVNDNEIKESFLNLSKFNEIYK